MHLFVEFKNPQSKFRMLKNLSFLYKGRIQIDPGRGSREECIKYLTDPDKSKEVDTNIINEVGVPKMRLHNHTNIKKFKKGCPRCEWLKYWEELLKGSKWVEEAAKPYLDYNGRREDLPPDKIKYYQ